jgi:PKD repeat protein
VLHWTFGDGTTSTVKNPTKFYTVSDYYYVKLIIVTSAGCRDTVTKTIFVKAAPPKPSLTLQPNKNHICVPELLKFYGTSGTGSVQSKWLLNNVNVLMNSDSLSWIFNDTVNQAHTVRYVLEDSNGCFSDSMITIFTHPLDTILLSKNNGYVCANSCDTLYGRLDTIYQSYEWEYSTDSLSWTSPMSNPGNAKEIVVCDTGYYRFKVYNGYGCTSYSRVIHVKFPPAFTMSSLSGDSTIVQGQTQLLQYMGSGFPNYQQYTWYRDGIPVLGPGPNLKTYGASKPGTYWLVATGQCGTERTNEIRVRHRAIDPQWDMTYISGFNFITSTTLSSVNGYRIGGDLIINMGVTLTISSHVQFDSCTRIIVNNGGTLQLSNAVFSGNKFWRGIQCHSSGTINAVNSDIWDAVIAIEGTGFAKITIQNCNFGLNMVHVATRGTNSNISNITVLTSRFGHLYTGPDSLMGCYMAHDGIYVLPIKYRYISLNSGTTPVSVSQNKLYLNKLFPGHYFTGIYCDSTLAPGIIGNEVLGWFDTAMHLFSNNQGNYTNNTINNQGRWLFGYPANNYIYGTAMYTAQEKQANISSNRIERYRYGIEYYRLPVGSSEPLTRIKENRILDGIHGLLASYKANPLLTGSSVNRIYSSEIPVQISCNLFDNDSLNILGLGNVRDTVFGFRLGGGNFKSAGNKFSSTSYYGCFWEELNPKLTPVYKFNSSSGYPEDPEAGTQPSAILDGTPGNMTITGFSIGVFNNNCVSIINRGTQPEIEEEYSNWKLNIYPNPFGDAFTLQSNLDIRSYTIYNLKGEKICEGNIAGLVNVSNWVEGLYFIRVINNSYEAKTIRLMKVDH